MVKIKYAGSELEAPSFLKHLWPHGLPLDAWPTFCGPGSKLGDWLVPDKILAILSPACFIHDVCWALSSGSKSEFRLHNRALFKNCMTLCKSQLKWYTIPMAYVVGAAYWAGVSGNIGWVVYTTGIGGSREPFENESVKKRLHTLAMASLEYMPSGVAKPT